MSRKAGNLRESRHVAIYGLVDPRDGRIHYVGKTVDLDARYVGHLRSRGYTPKHLWISALLGHDLEPEMIVLEHTTEELWADRERHWIAQGRKEGWPLKNVMAGGPEKPHSQDDSLFRLLPEGLRSWYRALDESAKLKVAYVCARAAWPPIQAWYAKKLDARTAHDRMIGGIWGAALAWKHQNA